VSSARIFNVSGTVTGTLDLPDEIFGVEVNGPVLHQALLRQLANARQGTHATRTRATVRGGGRKPYRQKGTGRARQGSIRAPQWAGGGVVFGPHPRSYRQGMPRKQRRLALRSALSAKARESQILVLGEVSLDEPRTRAVVRLLEAAEAGRRVLLVLGSHNEVLEKSARNIPEVRVTLAGNLSVRDLLTAETVFMTAEAVEHVSEALA
jgi:large subunit ribosomal protein L4